MRVSTLSCIWNQIWHPSCPKTFNKICYRNLTIFASTASLWTVTYPLFGAFSTFLCSLTSSCSLQSVPVFLHLSVGVVVLSVRTVFALVSLRINGIWIVSWHLAGTDLHQIVFAMQQTYASIPDFSSLTRPLAKFLKTVWITAGQQTHLAVGRIPLQSWLCGQEQKNELRAWKQALECRATRFHYHTSKRLCVFTEASEFLWAGVGTQISIVGM